jgi:hypothetical protein
MNSAVVQPQTGVAGTDSDVVYSFAKHWLLSLPTVVETAKVGIWTPMHDEHGLVQPKDIRDSAELVWRHHIISVDEGETRPGCETRRCVACTRLVPPLAITLNDEVQRRIEFSQAGTHATAGTFAQLRNDEYYLFGLQSLVYNRSQEAWHWGQTQSQVCRPKWKTRWTAAAEAARSWVAVWSIQTALVSTRMCRRVATRTLGPGWCA